MWVQCATAAPHVSASDIVAALIRQCIPKRYYMPNLYTNEMPWLYSIQICVEYSCVTYTKALIYDLL